MAIEVHLAARHLRHFAPAERPTRRFVYLGSGFRAYRILRDTLPKDTFIDCGRRLNTIASKLGRDVRSLDEQIAPSELPVWWLASDMSDYGQYTSTLLPNLARLLLFLELAEESEPPVFIVDDPLFGQALVKAARARGITAALHGHGGISNLHAIRDTAVRWLRMLYAGASHLRRDIGRLIRCRQLRPFPPPPYGLAATDVLVLTWAYQNTFDTETATPVLPLMGRLPSILRDAGLNLQFLAIAVDWIDPYARIIKCLARSPARPSVIEDLYGWREMLYSYSTYAAFFLKIGRKAVLANQSVDDLLKIERRRLALSFRNTQAARMESLVRRLAASGAQPKAILFPAEGQPWEKVLCRAVHQYLPATRTVGYLHLPTREHQLATFYSPREIDAGAMPHYIIGISNHQLRELTRRGVPPERLVNGGAFRYENLLRSGPSYPIPSAGSERSQTVICSTNLELESTLELVNKTITAGADVPGIKIIVTHHPHQDSDARSAIRNEVEAARAALGAGRHVDVQISTEPSARLMGDADAVVYHDSGTSYEALALGIPVIFVHRDAALDFNPLPNDFCSACRSPGDLAKIFQALGPGASNEQRIDGKPINDITEVMGPINPTAILRAIDGAPGSTPVV